jgi:hypothetical protein
MPFYRIVYYELRFNKNLKSVSHFLKYKQEAEFVSISLLL